ncbi:hypothetical protein MAR_020622 [Mya arenaria]|uniref:Uncharacterized protein n=1 Tax=Mya arenaria TaxID=6604 RepID=A0ABY7E5E4_MYAAR|nr:hypothetical protein MAR_020622 [Mya arenaria]
MASSTLCRHQTFRGVVPIPPRPFGQLPGDLAAVRRTPFIARSGVIPPPPRQFGQDGGEEAQKQQYKCL